MTAMGRLWRDPSAYSVVLPDDFKKNKISDAELNRLSQLIQMPVADIKQKIEDNKKAFGGLVIANDVGIDVATQIEERRDDYPNFIIEVRPLRVYPLNDAGGQILGYVGEAGPNDKDAEGNPYQLGTIIGRAGLEAEFNPYLEGKNGNKLVEVDASGRPVKTFDGIPVSQGHNIRLTLDSRIQRAAEDAIKEQMAKLGSTSSFATGASAVAMDPQTGAILAMVSWPSYDSNHFSQGITAAEWKDLINNPNHPMQNRTISSVYPPGSTFKVITASAALESHVTTPGERIFDSGKHWLIPMTLWLSPIMYISMKWDVVWVLIVCPPWPVPTVLAERQELICQGKRQATWPAQNTRRRFSMNPGIWAKHLMRLLVRAILWSLRCRWLWYIRLLPMEGICTVLTW